MSLSIFALSFFLFFLFVVHFHRLDFFFFFNPTCHSDRASRIPGKSGNIVHDYFGYCKCYNCSTVNGGCTHWALPVHTTFDDHGHILSDLVWSHVFVKFIDQFMYNIVNVICVKLCPVVVLNFSHSLPLSGTLITFQGHNSIKRLWKIPGCIFQ